MKIFNSLEKQILNAVITGCENMLSGQTNERTIHFSRHSREEISSVKKLFDIYCEQSKPTSTEQQNSWSKLINSSQITLPLEAYIGYIKIHCSDILDKDADIETHAKKTSLKIR